MGLLQAIYRRKRARDRLMRLLRGAYEKVWDPLKEQYYYHNARTGAVTWEKPAIIKEDDILTDGERAVKLAQRKARKAQKKAKRQQELWEQQGGGDWQSQQWESSQSWE